MENKAIIISTLTALAIGGAVGYFATPSKIETREIEKEVTKKIFLDRVITKITKPDGTIEERTEEKDRSEFYEKTEETTKVETNPKRIGVAVVGKTNVTEIAVPKIGVQVNADTGFFNTFVTGSAFQDGVITIGIGIRF